MSKPPLKPLVVKLSRDELTCRLMEAFWGVPRPLGAEALEAVEMIDPEAAAQFRAMAAAAMDYFHEVSASAARAADVTMTRRVIDS